MAQMHRQIVQLTPAQDKALKAITEKTGSSAARTIRIALDDYLKKLAHTK